MSPLWAITRAFILSLHSLFLHSLRPRQGLLVDSQSDYYLDRAGDVGGEVGHMSQTITQQPHTHVRETCQMIQPLQAQHKT